MKSKTGLWIDHRQAILVTISEEGAETDAVLSKVEKHLRRADDASIRESFKTTSIQADDRRQNATTEHLNIYYDEVIERIRDASAILIFGPGEAKQELKSRLDGARLGERVVAVETEDKMTEPQIEAKVREFFAQHHHARASV
jgi:hypothetical protein